ncbi:hypothetical protein [Actinophytocola oryzae]|uniref:Uncharacterized protein n=1 Tax=Actinophytocola oryzae TaxID=502181 RepID=A0A4R7V1C7_9PSEU|nr:hypothetical protein [Actinophytocola oryzae]TDV43098.1 hypothetical protein CLV71_11632 [Actinophytocola oryzae]
MNSATAAGDKVGGSHQGSALHDVDTPVRTRVAVLPRPRVAAIEWLDLIWPAGHRVRTVAELLDDDPVLRDVGPPASPAEARRIR